MQADGCSWSPDGKWIAFRGRTPGGRTKIYLVPSGGGPAQPLTSDDVEQGVPSWSPDGSRLAFGDVPEQFGRPSGSEALHVYDLTRRTVTTVPDSHGLWTSRWSPNGRYLSALTIRGQRLTIFDFASGKWRPLPADHVDNPNWTRDGAFIYYVTEGQNRALRRVRVADGVVEEVVNLEGYPTTTAWWSGLSLDDEPIILQAPGGVQIYALDVEQGR
jgi:Tol biopolymer transport system component